MRSIVRFAWHHLAEMRPGLVAHADGEQWIGRAIEVLSCNLASGRFTAAQPYLPSADGSDADLLSYAGQILEELLTESDLLENLRVGGAATWGAVIRRLERLAYHWLGPSGRGEWAAWEARDAAAHTCADLWLWLQSHPYPFDVPFDRWSARALNYRLHEALRKRRVSERRFPESLDRPIGRPPDATTVGDRFADTMFDLWLEQTINREALLQALDLLDDRLAEVLRLWYLEQWPADEIAAHIGERVGYVYVLRFRGIEKLRKIALQNERLGLRSALLMLREEGHRSRPPGHSDDQGGAP
ncbi:MAG: sigma-70 family RNA polymerase sigma factor [Chloroflexi bacterium]|nr:sigma-70 family RNA polymerase sigma factor [Chloroflexota bacterium]